MEEKKDKQARKAYKKHGEDKGGQKMFSFRLDEKLSAWLNSKPNKGRYINDLISRDIKRACKGYFDDEHTDVLDTIHDYEP